MCGIAGALDLRGRRHFDPRVLARMLVNLAHRGPDGSGQWLEPGIALGARRLAIRDVDHGQQPMSDPSERVHVVFNGELYNDTALREELRARGHRMSTRCDTELWPALYLDDPETMLSRARGQFALAVWDRETRTLLLARDRSGIVPLHYALVDGWLLWASEIKALLASGMLRAEVDVAGIDQVFRFLGVGGERTCFAGVRALLPGHSLTIDAHNFDDTAQLTPRRYWDLSFAESRTHLDAPAATTAMLECLRQSVARRLASDGPVAAYISGGLDSTLIAKLAAELRPDLHTFTVGVSGSSHDERAAAARHSHALGVAHEAIDVSTASLLDALPQVIVAAEAPIMDTADALVLRLARAVAERGYKVVLSGEGADENLAGYSWHKLRRALHSMRHVHRGLPDRARRALSDFVAPATTRYPLRANNTGLPVAVLDVYETTSRLRTLFYTAELLERVDTLDHFADLAIDRDRLSRWDPLHQSLYLEHKIMLAGHLLADKGDRVAMQSGLETRYPYLDETFVELSASLPPTLKLRGLQDKWLLRQVATRVLPKAIAHPPKRMFRAESLCLLPSPPRWVQQLISPESLRATGYFSPKRVAEETQFRRHSAAWTLALTRRRIAGDGTYTAVVMTQLWHHMFLGGGLCELTPWSAAQSEAD